MISSRNSESPPMSRRSPPMGGLQRASSVVSLDYKDVFINTTQPNFEDHFKIVDKELETTAAEYFASRPTLALTNMPGFLMFHTSARTDESTISYDKPSLSITCDNSTLPGTSGAQRPKFPRRHSSFQPGHRHALESYLAHRQMKQHFKSTPEARERIKSIETLLNFHVSVNLKESNFVPQESAGLHFSCPVLSYMNDDEEDSIDVVVHKKKSTSRRLSNSVVFKEEDELWEFLQDLEEEAEEEERSSSSTKFLSFAADYQQMSTSVLDFDNLPTTTSSIKPHGYARKPRRASSYKILSKMLSEESTQQVLHELECSTATDQGFQAVKVHEKSYTTNE